MKKKVVLYILMFVLLAAAIVGVIILKNHTVSNSKSKSYGSIEEANEAAEFTLKGSDRLCGYPATDYEASSNTVKITYDYAGFISKTLGEKKSSVKRTDYAESSEQETDGKTVTFNGNDGKVYLAEWNENGFNYIISVTDGVDADEMIEYVKATR